MQSWIQELRQLGPPNLVLAVAGNKVDIDDKRQVSITPSHTHTHTHTCIYFDSIQSYFNLALGHIINVHS